MPNLLRGDEISHLRADIHDERKAFLLGISVYHTVSQYSRRVGYTREKARNWVPNDKVKLWGQDRRARLKMRRLPLAFERL